MYNQYLIFKLKILVVKYLIVSILYNIWIYMYIYKYNIYIYNYLYIYMCTYISDIYIYIYVSECINIYILGVLRKLINAYLY
jgi:hypothetical protein